MSSMLLAADRLTNLGELAIFLYGLQRWEWLDRSRRLLAAWAGSCVVAAVGTALLTGTNGYDHIMLQLYLPLSALFAMGSLGALQTSRRSRDAFRIAGVLYAVIWAALTLTYEDLGKYSVITGPIHHVMITGGAAFTLQSALRRVQGPLLGDPAAVVGMGFLAFAAPTAMIHPVLTIFRNEPTLDLLLVTRDLFALLGYAALLHAIALPRFRRTLQRVAA
ncbi:MAG: hypothetical protein ABIZ70_15985 [Gemmatimonadales bacterium]